MERGQERRKVGVQPLGIISRRRTKVMPSAHVTPGMNTLPPSTVQPAAKPQAARTYDNPTVFDRPMEMTEASK